MKKLSRDWEIIEYHLDKHKWHNNDISCYLDQLYNDPNHVIVEKRISWKNNYL